MKEKEKFETNIFYYYANLYMDKATSDEEIRCIDITEEFWKEIEHELKNGELVDININAKVRMSKSTTGIYIGKMITEIMKRLKLKEKETKFTMANIARDQQEYSKIMRNKETKNTVIVTDEINELEETGENTTVERALNNVFSNVQAGRYVHRVSCSPKGTSDPNADIFLEIISVDRKKYITHCHLYYKMFKGGSEYMQLLGYVNFNVRDLIYKWETIYKKIYFKKKRTEEEKATLEKAKKEDLYTEYITKKYEKMELITEEGILRPRLLDYAEVILKIEKKLRPLTKMNILNKNTIKNYVRMMCRKEKIPTSIVGEELMTQEIEGILSLWKSYHGIIKEIMRNKEKMERNAIDIESYKTKDETLRNMRDEIAETISAQEQEMERYMEINKKYNEHLNSPQKEEKGGVDRV